MNQNDYVKAKAQRAYDLYKQGRFFEKTYAAVQKGNKFIVLKNEPTRRFKYSIAGGGVDEGESFEAAIKREILEELNIEAEVVKELGVYYLDIPREYNGEKYVSKYLCKVFLTKFVSYGLKKQFGLEGEFCAEMGIAEISKQELLKHVYEFAEGGIKL